MTLTNARTKVWTEPKGPEQKESRSLLWRFRSGCFVVVFFGMFWGRFFCFWEGVILQSLKLTAFFGGWHLEIGLPSLGVIFFGDCMHPMSFLVIVVREVSIGKFLRIVIILKMGTLPMQLPWFWI